MCCCFVSHFVFCVVHCFFCFFFFFFKQKTAYEMRISDWSSDVCSSDLSCCFKSASCRGSDVSTTSFFVNLYRLPSSAIASYSSRAEVIKRSIFFEFSQPEKIGRAHV